MTSVKPYSIEAYNAAKHSENKMHDDAVAKQFGFTGGLVPGVDVYAYMSHVPLQVWGRAFLERGEMEGRFIKPVYDGEIATVTATEANGGLDIQIESRGILCGTGHAKLLPAPAKFSIDDFKTSTPPANDRRPNISASSYKVGEWLGIHPYKVTPELHAQYLKDIRESRSDLCAGGPDPSGHATTPGQLGADPQCAAWSLDPRRQHDPADRARPCRGRADIAREGHWQLREEGPQAGRSRLPCGRQWQDAAGARAPHGDLRAAAGGHGGVAQLTPSP